MRKTKIVCTIGPACDNEDTLTQMCMAGMNVARLNFSHGSHEEHLKKIELIKRVRKQLNMPIAIMLDTKGPEYRTGRLADGSVMLNRGEHFTFTTEDVLGDRERVSVSYKNLPQELEVGDTVLVNNGLMVFHVLECTDTEVRCEVVAGGELTDRKSMSFPGKVLKQTYLSEQDKADIRFGVENDVDFIACSFVSRREDLDAVHAWLDELGAKNIDVIAKLENRSGVDNIEQICEGLRRHHDRPRRHGCGDPLRGTAADPEKTHHQVPHAGQARHHRHGDARKHDPQRAPHPARRSPTWPTAVYDGTSAIMLSGETAAGEHPVLAVETMSRIATCTERGIHYEKRFLKSEFKIHNIVDAISHATCGMSIDVHAKAIAVCSLSGKTVRMVSRFRSPVDILGITTSEKTWRKLALSWGVTPVMCETLDSTEVLFYSAKRLARKMLDLKSGDRIVITAGATTGRSGNTNLIKIETI